MSLNKTVPVHSWDCGYSTGITSAVSQPLCPLWGQKSMTHPGRLLLLNGQNLIGQSSVTYTEAIWDSRFLTCSTDPSSKDEHKSHQLHYSMLLSTVSIQWINSQCCYIVCNFWTQLSLLGQSKCPALFKEQNLEIFLGK